MNLSLLNIIYFTACVCLFIRKGTLTHILSYALIAIEGCILVVTFVLFYEDPHLMGCFSSSFKPKIIIINHYYFYTLTLIVAVCLLSFFPHISWVAGIPIGTMLIYTIAFRPYKEIKENIRSSFNLLAMECFIGFKQYLEKINHL